MSALLGMVPGRRAPRSWCARPGRSPLPFLEHRGDPERRRPARDATHPAEPVGVESAYGIADFVVALARANLLFQALWPRNQT
jgi:hypothetical protein